MKVSALQEEILLEMQKGKALSSLSSSNPVFGNGGINEFGGTLDGRYRSVPIATIKALLQKGLIVERHRWNVSDHLEHSVYALVETQKR